MFSCGTDFHVQFLLTKSFQFVAFIIIYYFQRVKMVKLKPKSLCLNLFLVLILSCLMWNSHAQCFGQNCKLSFQENQTEKYTLGQLVQAIDKEVRRVYWYYLDGAIQIFQSNIDVPSQKTIHFYIYRNKIGTYLAVASRMISPPDIVLNTFVRLGNGFIQDVPSSASPIFLQPFIISLKLSPNELIISQTSNNSTLNQTTQEKRKMSQQQKLVKIDKQIRTNYWYYLNQAFLINSSTVVTNQRTYAILSFINLTGTYLVIASIDSSNQVKVNTFVRLGGGSNTTDVKPIQIQPQVIALR